MKAIVVVTGCLSLVSVNAAAEGPGLSLEALAGYAKQETEAPGLQSISGDELAAGLRLGYRFHPYMGLELSYLHYGEAEDRYIDGFGDTISHTLETASLNLGFKGILPIENGFSLIGRAGMSRWDYEIVQADSAFPGQDQKADDDGHDFYYGIGAELALSQTLHLGLEYTFTQMDLSLAAGSAEHDVNNLAVALGYTF